MDPSWISAASSVLGAFKGSTKISGANAGSFAGAAALDLGDWQAASGTNKKWFVLGGVVLIGLLVINRKIK